MPQPFNIMIVGQGGRLQYEALVFVASLRAHAPGFAGRNRSRDRCGRMIRA